MKIKHGEREYAAIRPDSREMRMSDLAALQRETGWKMATVQEMSTLEVVSLQLVLYFTLRRNGHLVSFAKAGDLLDDVEFIPEDGDVPQEGEGGDPTPAPGSSAPGDGGPPASDPS